MTTLFRDVDGGLRCPRGSAVCIGAFDGLHGGHHALACRTVERARAQGIEPVALSFEPLPREYFATGAPPARLGSPRGKVEGLRARGIGQVGLLRFNAALARMTPEQFVDRVLVRRLAAREVWVGPGFRFGQARAGDIGTLHALGAVHGFTAHEIEPVHVDGVRVSSTAIRTALAAGDFATAARHLGRPFAMAGRVVRGKQLGRTLGYPTANLRVPGAVPAVTGIFATWVHGVGPRPMASVSSLGTRPTVDGVEPLLEAHLFDFDGDLYGRRIEVEFVTRLRDELKFPDLPSLIDQMHRDAAQARALLDDVPIRIPA